jgi:hypothetical protein
MQRPGSRNPPRGSLAKRRYGSGLVRRLPGSAEQAAQAIGGERGGLAGHRARQTLTLEGRRQVAVAAAGEQAGQELHDTSPCIEVTRGAFA